MKHVPIEAIPKFDSILRTNSRPASPITFFENKKSVSSNQRPNVNKNGFTGNLKTPTRSQELLNDESEANSIFAAMRSTAFEGLSEKDISALKIGRLILSTLIEQPEVSTADSLSRFFLDAWLAKYGSSFKKADGLSVELICNIERVANMSILAESVDGNSDHGKRNEKIVCAVACEALDVLVKEFGEMNPVLNSIRDAIFPCLFAMPMQSLDLNDFSEHIAEIHPISEDSASRMISGEKYASKDLPIPK
jgi:uncharacterized protein YsxB (DUF464 family)